MCLQYSTVGFNTTADAVDNTRLHYGYYSPIDGIPTATNDIVDAWLGHSFLRRRKRDVAAAVVASWATRETSLRHGDDALLLAAYVATALDFQWS